MMISGTFGYAQTAEKTISGRVSDGRAPIANVTVSVEDQNTETVTNERGFYTIKAAPGDIITYDYQGLKTVRIVVEDVTRVLNPTMIPDVQELDEVVIIGSNRKSQKELALEYEVNPNIIRTAYGYLNADTAPGNIRFMDAERINPVGICILDVLKAEFPGVRVLGSCSGPLGPTLSNPISTISGRDLNRDANSPTATRTLENTRQSVDPFGKVFIRGVNSVANQRAAIFDVDGQIFNVPPIWVDITNIRRIAILNNFATVTQYGSAATGGVVVINTISGNASSNKITDFARLRNNYFSGDLLTQQEALRNSPTYLQDLYGSSGTEDAKKTYEEWATKYGSSPYFALDAYRYFYEVRNDEGYADNIIEDNFWKFEKNAVLLKALAYMYESQRRFNKAHEIYKAVFKLRPNYGQSYMDLANSYRNLNDYKQAVSVYSRYEYLQDEELMANDTTEFTPIIERDYNNLLALHRGKIMDDSNASEVYVAPEDFFRGTRLVFEWNDGEAEFDLQFVNPENQFFTFKHSLAQNGDLIMREKLRGYSTTEYLIDNSMLGNWKINAKYLGNKSLTPSYLKATVYYNYGTTAQRKEVLVFKLGIKDKNVGLFELVNGTALAAK